MSTLITDPVTESFFKNWMKALKPSNIGLENYKRDIILIKMTAKLQHLNKRKFKKIIKKIPKTILKDCFPISSIDMDTSSGVINITLEYKT